MVSTASPLLHVGGTRWGNVEEATSRSHDRCNMHWLYDSPVHHYQVETTVEIQAGEPNRAHWFQSVGRSRGAKGTTVFSVPRTFSGLWYSQCRLQPEGAGEHLGDADSGCGDGAESQETRNCTSWGVMGQMLSPVCLPVCLYHSSIHLYIYWYFLVPAALAEGFASGWGVYTANT